MLQYVNNTLSRGQFSDLKDDDKGQASTHYMPVHAGKLVLVW